MVNSDDPKDRRPGSACAAGRERAGHHLAEPLAPEDRNLLNSLAFIGAEGRVLFPHEIRVGQKLEALGLCTLAAYDAQFAWGCYVSSAAITAAGLRAARIGEGAGPQLATIGGRLVAQEAGR